MFKLNLGCGQNRREGYINVDKYDSFSPDLVWDLEVFPWPFDTSSVNEIVMHHALEHMGASTDVFLSIVKELYRVSVPNATILIAVPHPRSDGFTGDPTHVRAINPAVMSLFSKKNNRRWKELGWPNTPLATYIDVDFEIVHTEFALTPYWAQQLSSCKITKEDAEFAVNSYFNVADEIKITLKVCK